MRGEGKGLKERACSRDKSKREGERFTSMRAMLLVIYHRMRTRCPAWSYVNLYISSSACCWPTCIRGQCDQNIIAERKKPKQQKEITISYVDAWLDM